MSSYLEAYSFRKQLALGRKREVTAGRDETLGLVGRWVLSEKTLYPDAITNNQGTNRLPLQTATKRPATDEHTPPQVHGAEGGKRGVFLNGPAKWTEARSFNAMRSVVRNLDFTLGNHWRICKQVMGMMI